MVHSSTAGGHESAAQAVTAGFRRDLVRHGAASGSITVTGPVVNPGLVEGEESLESVRTRLGLDLERRVLVLTGGSRGRLDYVGLARVLGESDTPVQIVALVGENSILQRRLAALQCRNPIIVSTVPRIGDWIRAADVVLGKPGGMTSAEVLSIGRPLVLLQPQAGMEEAQQRRLVDYPGVRVAGGAGEALRLALEAEPVPPSFDGQGALRVAQSWL